MGDIELRKPTERQCELCGRREVWDESSCSWRVERVDGSPQTGNVYCLHEWDINGTFVPIWEDDGDRSTV
jgi:hypothetical protein